MGMNDFIAWFSGGRNGYMNLVHCMNHDYFWITVTVLLDFAVAIGYVVIALHWRLNERNVRNSPAKASLADMKRIFIFCGICGYLFIPIKMFWPAWRLYDIVLCGLIYYTWSYALRARELSVVYRELDRSEQLANDLLKSREESRRKSEFLSAISHDMKTPLSALLLQAELAEMHLSRGELTSVVETFDQMKSCVRTTTALLNHFLEVGRLEVLETSAQPVEIRLDQFLRAIADQFSLQASEKGLKMVLATPSNSRLTTDCVMLERILINLIDNAIKYTRQGSVQIQAVAKPSTVVIEVIDSGAGISNEHHARIFDDFVQLDNRERDSRKGLGLGLSISKRLADRIGAKLTLESQLNVGSRFAVEVPISPRLHNSNG